MTHYTQTTAGLLVTRRAKSGIIRQGYLPVVYPPAVKKMLEYGRHIHKSFFEGGTWYAIHLVPRCDN